MKKYFALLLLTLEVMGMFIGGAAIGSARTSRAMNSTRYPNFSWRA